MKNYEDVQLNETIRYICTEEVGLILIVFVSFVVVVFFFLAFSKAFLSALINRLIF